MDAGYYNEGQILTIHFCFCQNTIFECIKIFDLYSVSEFRGLLGPPEVVFDISANSGTLLVDADRLGVRAMLINMIMTEINFCSFFMRVTFPLLTFIDYKVPSLDPEVNKVPSIPCLPMIACHCKTAKI